MLSSCHWFVESNDIHKCSTCGYLKYLGPKDPNLHILRWSHKHWNIYLCNLAFNFWKLPLSWSHFNWYWNLIDFKTKVLTWKKDEFWLSTCRSGRLSGDKLLLVSRKTLSFSLIWMWTLKRVEGKNVSGGKVVWEHNHWTEWRLAPC